MRCFFCLIIFAFMVSACSPRVTVNSYKEATSARLSQPAKEDCQIHFYSVDEPVEQENQALGDIRIDDSGFSVDCGKDKVMGILKREACKTGADAVIILKELNPDFFSSCYRVQARFIKFTEMDEASEKTASASADPKPPETKGAGDSSKTALNDGKGKAVAGSIFGYVIGYALGFALVAVLL